MNLFVYLFANLLHFRWYAEYIASSIEIRTTYSWLENERVNKSLDYCLSFDPL